MKCRTKTTITLQALPDSAEGFARVLVARPTRGLLRTSRNSIKYQVARCYRVKGLGNRPCGVWYWGIGYDRPVLEPEMLAMLAGVTKP